MLAIYIRAINRICNRSNVPATEQSAAPKGASQVRVAKISVLAHRSQLKSLLARVEFFPEGLETPEEEAETLATSATERFFFDSTSPPSSCVALPRDVATLSSDVKAKETSLSKSEPAQIWLEGSTRQADRR